MRLTTRTIGLVTAVAAMAVTAIFGVTSGATAASSDVGTTAATISLGTHNVHGGYDPFEFKEFAGVIGWQEAKARGNMWRDLDGYKHYVPSPEPAKVNPISYRATRFTLIRAGYKKTHDGEAGVTPARYIVWVVLKVNSTGRRFIVINTHFISGAWNKHPERQARWLKHYQILYNRVKQFREHNPGKPIFVVGDFNRRKAMDMPWPVKWVPVNGVSGVPIDHMYAPSNIDHTNVKRLYKWGSDHYAYKMWATF